MTASTGGTGFGSTGGTGFGGAPALTVGIISAGRVGTAVGECLERAGHRVTHAAAASAQSVNNVRTRLPSAVIATPERAAADVELVVIAVPDNQIASVATQIAPYLGPGVIVIHVAGALGREPLAPCEQAGALTLAMHPAMTFLGDTRDTDNLDGCGWGVTAADDIGLTVAELLATQMGGRIIPIEEQQRTTYHAAMAIAANLTSTLIADATDALAASLPPGQFTETGTREAAALLLGPLAHAAVTNTLSQGRSALTGPVARRDIDTVRRHIESLHNVNKHIADAYRNLSAHTARQNNDDHTASDLDK